MIWEIKKICYSQRKQQIQILNMQFHGNNNKNSNDNVVFACKFTASDEFE